MRTTETILDIISERGRRGLPLEDIYRLLYKPELHLTAYGRISSNRGAITPGVTPETADGMSLSKIMGIIEQVRQERYKWTPVRRTYIPKRNGKLRPLGIPTWSDRLLQEVMRLILDAYYDPQFSDSSCGFRTNRGCHTALRAVSRWKGTTWFIEGDIAKCFDTIDHAVLMSILGERIHDGRFLRLIDELLKAGYLEDWRYGATLSGTPQGGIISPLLSNIYLDRLDKYVENVLLPEYNRGEKRRRNMAHHSLSISARHYARTGRVAEARARRLLMRQLPSADPRDPEFRRLRYVRYADDFLLGFTGPRSEAEEIKRRLGGFLGDTLNLELSEEKTLITHGRTETARFLGYELSVAHEDSKLDQHGRRMLNGVILLRVPKSVAFEKMAHYRRGTRAIHRPERFQDDAFSIVRQYQAEFRGLANYYQLAINVRSLNYLKFVMERSLVKTLALKYRTKVSDIYRRYATTLSTPAGPRKGLMVRIEREGKEPLIAVWGGVSLARNVNAILNDTPRREWNTRSEIVERLLAQTCELCGSQERIEIHHIRALKDLKQPGRADKPLWVQKMAARRRKKLVVCQPCHAVITHGKPRPTRSPATMLSSGH
jgi:group II intron reverse transcriptase/maturase